MNERNNVTYIDDVYDIARQNVVQIETQEISFRCGGVNSKSQTDIGDKQSYLCEAQTELHDTREQKESGEEPVRSSGTDVLGLTAYLR